MQQYPDQLSQLILEADGLLLLLHKHREDTPTDVIVMLRKKLQLILSLIDGLEDEPEEGTAPDPCESYTANQAGVFESAEEHYDSIPQEDVGEYVEDTIENTAPELNSGFTDEHEQPVNEAPSNVHYDYMPQYDDESPLDDYNEPDEPTSNYITGYQGNVNTPRRPVSTIFNLNDKFRFRRELFGNSEVAYVECLNMLTAMNSFEEAEDYLYQDLQWDPQNEDVMAFMELLANYYR